MTAARLLDHPSEVVTAAYLEGTLDPETTERVERHLASCMPCRSLVRDARAVAGAPEAAVPAELLARAREMAGSGTGSTARTVDAARSSARWIFAGGVATAAIIVVAIVLIARPAPDRRGGLAVETGEAGGTRYRASDQGALAPLAPAPGARIETPEATLTWSALPDAERYVVTVLDTGGTVLATIEVRAPASSAAFAWTGKRPATLLWKVRALRLDRTLAESRPVSFEMR
jgi:predicted anti-sigma-YlaC factor YlaD